MISPRTLGTGLMLAALTTSLALTVRRDSYYTDSVGLACWLGTRWLLFAAAVWCLRKVAVRHVVTLILGGSVIVAATGRTFSSPRAQSWAI
ncbi:MULTISPECIES: hypothetical protein [Streptomyces]|uniref:Uncharacterized protein n=1 Tax=Streptomyces achmelvichensis TaxID=3134111 RepID=A0ACC6Q8X0_9ACTN|nr:hypothetical protein [Streptomyces sp. NBC_00306]